MRRIYSPIFVPAFGGLAALVALSGCGVPRADAPKSPIRAEALKEFPPQDWILRSNRLFMWKTDVTARDVSEANQIGGAIDETDAKAIPLNRRIKSLKDQINVLSKQLNPTKIDLQSINVRFSATNKDLTQAKQGLSNSQKKLELEQQKPATQQDPKLIIQYQVEIGNFNGQISVLTRQLDWLTSQRVRLQKEAQNVQKQIDPIRAEMAPLTSQQNRFFTDSLNLILKLTQVVVWFGGQPSEISFKFDSAGRISGAINGWNLDDGAGPRTFQSNPSDNSRATMGNLRYTPLGGVFEFEAYVYAENPPGKLRETYAFRIGRIKYNSPDGRNFFGGEITRSRYLDNGDIEIGKGYAKMIDKNN